MRARCLAGTVAASVMLLALTAGAAVAHAQLPTCIGAAVLDPKSGCIDRLLTVFPTVADPHDEPLPDCRPLRGAAAASSACVIGASASRAKLQFALIGDSHTEAWSAVLGELGHEQGWRGTVFTGNGCAMSEAVYELAEIVRGWCVPAYQEAMRWLRHHPEIDVVFVTHAVHRGLPGPAATAEPRKILGFQQTFKGYPRNVRRVIVIADTPYTRQAQFDCLTRAILAALAPAGAQCASPRDVALRPDAAVLAAAGLHSARYQVVDMNDEMCSTRECYPALGGMLVNRDVGGHLTVTFARTMREQLLRRLEPLLAAPPAAKRRVDEVSTSSGTPCALSDDEAQPPGGNPTYNLTVKRARVTCPTAKKVISAFHRCRATSSSSCKKTLLDHWRCTGEKESSTAAQFYGTLNCTYDTRRVRSSYQQSA